MTWQIYVASWLPPRRSPSIPKPPAPIRCGQPWWVFRWPFRTGEAYYIPVGHTTGEPQLPLAQVLEALRPALTDPKIPKIGHNLKYD